MENPFIISSYKLPIYFCNRNQETEQLKEAFYNGRNIVLLSLRRMGKTGLIKHLFYQLKSDKNIYTFYFDIMNTNSTEEFVNKLANTILETFSSKSKKIYNTIFSFFAKFKPVITFNEQTGAPIISFNSQTKEQTKSSITAIFNYLEQQNKRIYIAIDEFQQITNYPDKSFEAFLRSHIQHLNNVNFIFSGSQQQILTSMFSSYSRPFYQSTDFLKLDRIPIDIYADFIVKKFNETKKTIIIKDVKEILLWLDTFTFYVQNFFNRLWYISDEIIEKKTIEETKQLLLNEHEFVYLNMRNLLSQVQYKLLKSIAIENGVEQPTSKEFINKYGLSTTSTISSAIKTLIEKELIYKENNVFKIYDLFFSNWLKNNNY